MLNFIALLRQLSMVAMLLLTVLTLKIVSSVGGLVAPVLVAPVGASVLVAPVV